MDAINPPKNARRSFPRNEPASENASAPIRVVVAEDAYVIREFLTTALGSSSEVELVAVCTTGKE